MPALLTYSQALSLSTDEASRKNALGLVSTHKWLYLNKSEHSGRSVVWGETQGSMADPYHCQCEPDGSSFHCTCPSKKRPCKHALGLLLLFIRQPETFETGDPPHWVSAWLAKDAQRGPHQVGKTRESQPGAGIAEKQRRAAGREMKIRAGLDELETWLNDLLRQGLAGVPGQPKTFWENASARLVDAQAPGFARMVRAIPGIAASGEGWQERLLVQIARLYLAIEGYRRINSLPENTQVDVRSLAGIHTKQEDLQKAPTVQDTWLVMGRDIEEEAKLKTQRTWLYGRDTSRPALILSFSAAGAALDNRLVPGSALQAGLVFYPGAFPLRANVRSWGDTMPFLAKDMPGSDNFEAATAEFSSALALYPWLEQFPIALKSALPIHENDAWWIWDTAGRRVQLARQFLHGWTLLALGAGRPMGMFGEWNGERFMPLSAWADGQFTTFRPNLEVLG